MNLYEIETIALEAIDKASLKNLLLHLPQSLIRSPKNCLNKIFQKNSFMKKQNKFIEVDVWQNQFSKISERAIAEIFCRSFSVKQSEVKGHSFRNQVDALRGLENPDYKPVSLPLTNH